MINGVKSSGGFSAASFRPVGNEARTPAVGQQPGQGGLKDIQSALQQISENPIVRALLGESGFDGVKGKGGQKGVGKAEKSEKAEKSGKAPESPEQALKQLVDGLKKFVETLEQMLGKKNETQAGAEGAKTTGGTEGAGGAEGAQQAGGAEGAQQAGGAEGAQQAGGAEGAQEAGGAEGAQQAGGAEGAQEAGGAEGAQEAGAAEDKNPLAQILETLNKIIEQLQQLLTSFGQQQQPGNTGIVPPASPEQSGSETAAV